RGGHPLIAGRRNFRRREISWLLACGAFRATLLRSLQKREQCRISLRLRPAVKIDATIERFATAREALLEPPVERLETRRGPPDGGRGARRSLARRRRFAGRFQSRRIGRPRPQRRDRAGDLPPELALLGIEPARAALGFAHVRGRHRTGPTWRRNFFPRLSSSPLPADCLDLLCSRLTSTSGICGFGTGSG